MKTITPVILYGANDAVCTAMQRMRPSVQIVRNLNCLSFTAQGASN
jgi:hypothetical protein